MTMAEPGDEFLIKRIKANDQKALELLFEKYYFSLCHFAKSFVVSTDLSEEIVSDVFLKLWLNREKIEIRSSLKAYLFIAIKNQALNLLKKNHFPFENLDHTEAHHLPAENSTELPVTYAETEKELLAIIDQLPPQRRTIFKLNRIEGLMYKEIAEVLSISVNTVQKQMVEAIKYVSKYKSQFYQLCINGLTLINFLLS